MFESLLLTVAAAVLLVSSTTRRWTTGVLPCILVAVLVTPADLVSTLMVAGPLCLAFVLGVAAGPFVRGSTPAG